MGPPALQQAVSYREAFNLTRPVYNFCMKGIVTCFTGVRKKDELVSKIKISVKINCVCRSKTKRHVFTYIWQTIKEDTVMFRNSEALAIMTFWFKTYVDFFFAISDRFRFLTKMDHRYISTFQKNLRNVCLSVTLEFCLLSVHCERLPAYLSLW